MQISKKAALAVATVSAVLAGCASHNTETAPVPVQTTVVHHHYHHHGSSEDAVLMKNHASCKGTTGA